jgi:hypothetical protein
VGVGGGYVRMQPAAPLPPMDWRRGGREQGTGRDGCILQWHLNTWYGTACCETDRGLTWAAGMT